MANSFRRVGDEAMNTSARFDLAVFDRIVAAAKADDRTIASYIRNAIKEYFNAKTTAKDIQPKRR